MDYDGAFRYRLFFALTLREPLHGVCDVLCSGQRGGEAGVSDVSAVLEVVQKFYVGMERRNHRWGEGV